MWGVALSPSWCAAWSVRQRPVSRGDRTTSDGRLRVEFPQLAATKFTYKIACTLRPPLSLSEKTELWIDAALFNNDAHRRFRHGGSFSFDYFVGNWASM